MYSSVIWFYAYICIYIFRKIHSLRMLDDGVFQDADDGILLEMFSLGKFCVYF